jgi:pyruvate, orthophosphate dikinase
MAMTKAAPRARLPKQSARWIYRVDEFDRLMRREKTRDAVRALLGGKGANLAEMTALGLPVPPGFTVSTDACRAVLTAGEWPKGLWEEEVAALHELEARTGKRFGDAANPLLVSCRSGAKFSMPGMMDTVLNIGLNDQTVLGLASLTGDARFAWDAYRRLVQMYGSVVLGVRDERFQEVLSDFRKKRGVENDADLSAQDLQNITTRFRTIVRTETAREFPTDPLQQLRLATEAVFRSWKGKRAQDYRKAAGIPDDLGTAVNIVLMVFGNMGLDSATGVATTRNVSTGEHELEGDYLTNAQGEDVVAGTRTTKPIAGLREEMPTAFRELVRIARLLERHYREVQDIEFTIERGKLWMLQTRDAKRTARAAVRIAVEFARERLITRAEAVLRVEPGHVDLFLHPQFDLDEMRAARADGRLIASGLNVSPGAATGQLAFDADTAERWAKEKREVILIRAETKPDDVHGLLAARGVLTSHGGRTSHAALVARQFGKPAVVGVLALEIDAERRVAEVQRSPVKLREGDWVSIDGTTGEVFLGKLPTLVASLDDPFLLELLGWADRIRTLEVWANADYPRDAERARALGAEGIGLCRTEHMFFETDRLPLVQKLILSRSAEERAPLLAQLLPMQRSDFEGLFRAMGGKPVVIRLIDPPLHEFLPAHDGLVHAVAELETRLRLKDGDAAELEKELRSKRTLLTAVQALHEQNPMLGLRGVRLGIHMPELVTMQVRAIFEAACKCQRDGIRVLPKIMIPLIAHSNELKIEQGMLETEARLVMAELDQTIRYRFGTMVEVPRAALTADQIAVYAQFFSFGTNDLTQTTFGISRDDAETGFLLEYLQKGVFAENPFATLDERGVGQLMAMAVKLGRATRPKMEIGICGEHGGDPKSIALCYRLGLTYVSCSPFRVPGARLAAAHAVLAPKKGAATTVAGPAPKHGGAVLSRLHGRRRGHRKKQA